MTGIGVADRRFCNVRNVSRTVAGTGSRLITSYSLVPGVSVETIQTCHAQASPAEPPGLDALAAHPASTGKSSGRASGRMRFTGPWCGVRSKVQIPCFLRTATAARQSLALRDRKRAGAS